MQLRGKIRWAIAYAAAFLSASFAARYGYKNADNVIDGVLTAAVLCVVALFAIHGFAWAGQAWRRKRRLAAVVMCGVCLVALAVSLAGGVGTVANKADKGDAERAASVAAGRDLRAERARKVVEREAIKARPRGAIEAEITTAKAERRFSLSSSCDPSQITAQATRDFCAGYRRLEAELAGAQSLELIAAAIREIDGKLDVLPAVKASNPQAELLARVLPIDVPTAEAIYAFGVSFGIELVALAAIIAADIGEDEPRRPVVKRARRLRRVWRRVPKAEPLPDPLPEIELEPAARSSVVAFPVPAKRKAISGPRLGRCEHFLLACLVADDQGEKARLDVWDILTAYKAWCAKCSYQALDDDAFGEAFAEVCKKIGIVVIPEGKSLYCVGLRLVA